MSALDRWLDPPQTEGVATSATRQPLPKTQGFPRGAATAGGGNQVATIQKVAGRLPGVAAEETEGFCRPQEESCQGVCRPTVIKC